MAETFEFYCLEGNLLAFAGVMGSEGVFVWRGRAGGAWEYFPAGSSGWDLFHQRTYRNSRADRATFADLEPVPSLPPLPAITRVDWQAQFADVKDPALLGPGPLFDRVFDAPGHWIRVSCVLEEDLYETTNGDGKFLNLADVFFSEREARDFIARKTSEADGMAYTVKSASLAVENGRLSLRDFKLELFEHVAADKLLLALAAKAKS